MKIYKWAIVSVGLLLAGLPGDAAQKASPTNFFAKALQNVELGKGMQSSPIIVFPLIAKKGPEKTDVVADVDSHDLSFSEPKWPEKMFDVGATNSGTVPVLLLGGNVLIGGKIDRMLQRDIILPGKNQMEVSALPAAYAKDGRDKAVAFHFGASVAPVYLRKQAFFDPSPYLVPIFVSHFLEFKNPKDKRDSLAAIDDSQLLGAYCVSCQKAMAEFPDVSNHHVVGFITAVYGRIHTLELFGSNDLLKAYFPRILRSHAYAAAALQIKAKQYKIKLPSAGESALALQAATDDAKRFLAQLASRASFRAADLPRAAAGKEILVRTPQSQGFALSYDGKLVHASVFPESPLANALYARPVKPPPGGEGPEVDYGELERRGSRGHLSEWEKRLLERMRQRRGTNRASTPQAPHGK